MAMKVRKIINLIELWSIAGSRGLEIWISVIRLWKSDIGWPQQPLAEKLLKFNGIFMIVSKNFFFKTSKFVLKSWNSGTWMTLKSSEVISKTQETSAASLTSAAGASATSLALPASPVLYPPRNSWSWWFDHPWHQNDHYWSLVVQ